MTDKRQRKQPVYVHRTNAVHITLYSPDGSTVPAEVRKKFEELATELALNNKLLVGLATT